MKRWVLFFFGSPQRTLATLSVCAVLVLIEYRHPSRIGHLVGRLIESVLFAILHALTTVIHAVLPLFFNAVLPILILMIGLRLMWKKL